MPIKISRTIGIIVNYVNNVNYVNVNNNRLIHTLFAIVYCFVRDFQYIKYINLIIY